MSTNKCICVNIPQEVRIRKYPIDVVELNTMLRERRKEVGLTIGKIAELLDIPKTKVEHYFRVDKSAAIPEPQIWPRLSELLGISDKELDRKIMTFITQEGVFESAERCYWYEGLAPTITTSGEDVRIITET